MTVVEVPVTVLGRGARPVAGLKSSDFELWADGKKQEISGFDELDLSKRPDSSTVLNVSGAATTSSLAQTRWMVVFDLSYTSLTGLLRARQAAKAFVGSAPKGDLAAVSTISGESGWKLLVNFTQDRKQLSRAIETLGMTGLGARAQDPLDFAYMLPGPLASSRGIAASPVSDEDQLRKELQTMRQANSNERAQGRVLQFVASLGAMARSLQSVRGRKHVLFFSEGFDSRLLAGNAGREGAPYQESSPSQNMDTTGEASANGELWKVNSDTRFGSFSTRQVLGDALSKLRSTDTVIHAIDISGLRAEGDMTKPPGAAGSETLFEIADGTGGELVRNANELGDQLQRIVEHTRIFYLLAFQPKGSSKPGSFHTLKVKVKAEGTKVLARSGYYEPAPFARLSPIERVLASGDLITGGMREDQLHVRVLTASFPVDLALAQVPLILEIPFAGISTRDSAGQTAFQIYVYAADPQGTLTDYLTQELSVDIVKVGANGAGEGIKYYGTLLLPPGDYELRVLVSCATVGQSSVKILSLQVPVVPGGRPVVLPPLFEASTGGWTLIKGPARSEAALQKATYPFAVGAESFVPAAAATLSNGKETRVALMTYNFGQGSDDSLLRVRPEILDESGRVYAVSLTSLRSSDGERFGGRDLLLGFRPQGLAPGRYRLKVAVSDPNTGSVAENTGLFDIR